MLLHLIWITLLSLASSLPVESELNHKDTALAIRDTGDAMALEVRDQYGISYTVNQNFIVHSAGPSFNGPFTPNGVSFYFQTDGNFVAYIGPTVKSNAVWASDTSGHSRCSNPSLCYLAFLADGNLVISVRGNVIWSTGTAGRGYTLAFAGQAPYIAIYNKDNTKIWSSGGGATRPDPPDDPCSRGSHPICQ